MSDGLKVHVIAGRVFAEVPGMTYRRHLYVIKHYASAKLEAGQPVLNIVDPSHGPAILAGFLVPVEEGTPDKWTPEGADALAEWFGSLEDPEAFEVLNAMLLGLVQGFFGGSGHSSGTFPIASANTSDEMAAPPPTSEAPEKIEAAPSSAPLVTGSAA
jgi:hypothetical protein